MIRSAWKQAVHVQGGGLRDTGYLAQVKLSKIRLKAFNTKMSQHFLVMTVGRHYFAGPSARKTVSHLQISECVDDPNFFSFCCRCLSSESTNQGYRLSEP